MATSPLHVIIIGAGTGGMCLAHGLKRAGISVAVYERDRTRADALLGYRVGINPDGSRALHACLPPELYDVFVATCARPMKRGNFLTEQLDEVLSVEFPENYDPVESEKSVSRITLRQVLLTGMDDVVHFDKTFTRYEQRADGKVTAFFADGTSATGDVLVAADGTRSAVRRQYLPHARLEDAEIAGGAGKVPLTDEVRRLLPPRMLEGTSIIFAPKGFFCILHVMEFPWGEGGQLKEGIGGPDHELLSQWPGLLYDNTRDHIIWGVAAPPQYAPADLLETKGTEFVKRAKEMTQGWSPVLHRLFDLSDPGTCFAHRIQTSVPIPQWETTNVTLLGDAIHTMTPGRGVGANTALRDAALLCRKLVAARDGRLPLLRAIREYETRMIDYGFDAVRESLKQQGKDNPLQKPVLGRMMLATMRGGMRLANALPPVRRKMAASMLKARGADRDDE